MPALKDAGFERFLFRRPGTPSAHPGCLIYVDEAGLDHSQDDDWRPGGGLVLRSLAMT